VTSPYHQPRLPGEFRVGGGFGRTAAPFIAVLALVFLILVLLGSVGTRSVLGGIGIGAAGTLIPVLLLSGKLSRMRSRAVVRFSPSGMELSDAKGFRVRLRWQDVTHLGIVHTQLANPRTIGTVDGDQITVGAMTSTGIFGWGERTVPPDIPAWLHATLDAQPVNPADGRPQVCIPLGGIDPQWQHGAMGEWLRRYRPDLLPPSW
jgi:hypothetical protein